MPSSKELLAAVPTADAAGDVTYLGVPKGYKAVRVTPEGREEFVEPKYQPGAQYKPNGLAPEIRAQIQTQMDAAGLYQKGDVIRIGKWDDTTVAAYTKLLNFANQAGRSVPEALQELGTLSKAERAELGLGPVGKGGVAGKSAKAPLTVTLSNPADLRALVDRTARKTLGRAPSESEMQRFVTAYQSLEQQEQRQADAASEVGGTLTAAPDPSVFAEQQVEAMDPVAAEAARQVSIFKTISGALGGMRGQ